MNNAFKRLYPEISAGGYDRDDQKIMFFHRLHALISEDMVVADFGAGRGLITEAPDSYLKRLQILKGKVGKVIGVDVDSAVLENKAVDEAVVISVDGVIPLPDNSVDLIYSCATFEHIANPEVAAQELFRILKPGGWLCAWTVNKWGYVGLFARLIPNRFHHRIVKAVEVGGLRQEKDVFPTTYKLNTITAIRKYFPHTKWQDCSYYLPGHPSYNAGSIALAYILDFYNKKAPDFMKKNLHVFLRKK